MNYGSSLTYLCLHMLGGIATKDANTTKDTTDNYGLPPDVADGLREYGLDPRQFYIDPSQPNTILKKPEYE